MASRELNRKVARLRRVARAAGVTLNDEQIARLANLDFLIDTTDEEMDTLLDELGLADPDEIGEPAAASPRAAGLRMAIRSTRDRAVRSRLQAQYRALPLVERRELFTAELVDENAGRRIVRVVSRGKRDAAEPAPAGADAGTLYGHFAVFDTWTEVESMWEGNFMEKIAPGAFEKTIAADAERMRVTLNHGRDPSLGNKVLGRIRTLAEDKNGAAYQVSLYRGIPELVMEGLRDDAYGASFRFYVNAEEVVSKPKASDYNPRAIPERTITEADVEEFGPVTFPQYPEASAHVRSLAAPRSNARPAAAPAASLRSRSRDEWLASAS